MWEQRLGGLGGVGGANIATFWAKMPQLQRRASIHVVTYVSRWRQQCAMVKEAERVAGGRPLDAVVPTEPVAEET